MRTRNFGRSLAKYRAPISSIAKNPDVLNTKSIALQYGLQYLTNFIVVT